MHSIKFVFLFVTLAAFGLLSCSKEKGDLSSETNEAAIAVCPPPAPTGYIPPASGPSSNKILVDATRDGGGWWYPQYEATGFSATEPHQGKALADYLRSQGYRVDELGRGVKITHDLLSQYDRVIRAGGAGNYSASELAAYDSFLSRSSALLLIQEHQKIFPNDALAQRLDLPFTGAVAGTVTSFYPHAITEGVVAHQYIAGSVIPHPDKNKITALGTLRTGADSTEAAAMGILHHRSARVFFIGDINGLEQVPQPFTGNLVKWLFK